MKRYTVPKGKHAFLLNGWLPVIPMITRDTTQVAWQVRFDTSYYLPFPDSWDWNKGGGLSYDLHTNHTDSAMWGWRYNDGMFELCVYCHVEGKRIVATNGKPGVVGDAEVMLRAIAGQEVLITMRVDRVNKRYRFAFSQGRNVTECWVPFEHSKRLSRTIGPWFGGNRAAPEDVTLYIGRDL